MINVVPTLYRFLLTIAAVAALVTSSPAGDLFRLDRLVVVRFTALPDGRVRRQQGVLREDGSVELRGYSDMARPDNLASYALGRNLITVPHWTAFRSLGTDATRSFQLEENAVTIAVGSEYFHFVAPDPQSIPANGSIINLSTRGQLTNATGSVIGGLVVEQHSRTVLIRAVGPSLARFGVTDPASNPRLVLINNQTGEHVAVNDDWTQQSNASLVRDTAARVGAFPLDEGSNDAALLLELPPGSFSAVIESASGSAGTGTVLLEVYQVSA